jgi:hypothetical protein
VRLIQAANGSTRRIARPSPVTAVDVPKGRLSGSPGRVGVPGTWTRPEETLWRG